MGGEMRALRWVVTCTVLLAAGTAYGAEPVKIRASWIVAPSDWTPLLLEKPELMKNNGKTYAFEPQRFQGTPAVITALANNEIELGNLALLLTRAGDPERRPGRSAYSRRPVQGRHRRQLQQSVLRAQRQPGAEGRGSERQDRRDQCGRQRGRHCDARHAAQARTRGQARLHPGRGALSHHEGHAGAEKNRPRVVRGTVLVRSRAQADRPATVQPARRARPHADDRVGGARRLPAEKPRRHGRFHGGFGAGRALVSRSQESRRSRADRGQNYQAAAGTVRGLAVHQQGIFAQPRSPARPGGAAVQYRRAARPRISQGPDRRTEIHRPEHRARGGAAGEVTGRHGAQDHPPARMMTAEQVEQETGMPPTAAISRTAKSNIAPAEWEQRVQLAACYRLVEHFGWTDLIYTHISARVPDEPGHFLLNRFGLLFDEVTASNLIKVDLDGNLVDEPDAPMHRAGFVIHSAIHGGRDDVDCVIHTHSKAGVAVAAMKDGLLPLSQHAQLFYGRVSYHDYEGLAIDIDERQRLVRDLGDNPVMILRNHGLLAVGTSIPLAFSNLFNLQFACETQVLAMAGHAALNLPPAAVSAHTAKLAVAPEAPFGTEWAGLLRKLDRQDPSYRT